jgi:drug/metabolite transporter (DMT)-like permease
MNALVPLIAAFLQATSFTLDKEVLNLKRVNYRRYLVVSFPLIAFFSVVLWLGVRSPLPFSSMSVGIWLLLAFMVADIVVTNILFYRALQSDYLHELELWQLSFRIPAILVTALLFADERNGLIIVLALVSAVAVIWSHLNHTKLTIRRRTAPYILWGLVMAPVAAAVIKLLLRELHPVSLELLRMVPVAVVFWLMFRSAMKPIGTRSWLLLLLTNALTFTAGVLLLFGYQSLGIIATGLLFSVAPLLVYFFSLVFLGEPFVKKKFAAFVVVLVSITVAQVAR